MSMTANMTIIAGNKIALVLFRVLKKCVSVGLFLSVTLIRNRKHRNEIETNQIARLPPLAWYPRMMMMFSLKRRMMMRIFAKA